MKKIIDIKTADKIATDLKKQSKTIVVTGGCFDILHIGHIKLLKESKKQGDYLFVLLENDITVKKIKGDMRPINSQEERAEILSELKSVDYVVKLDEMKSDKDYDEAVNKLMPDIITTTYGDPQGIHNKRQAKKVGAKVVFVINRIKNRSTTKLAEIIEENFAK